MTANVNKKLMSFLSCCIFLWSCLNGIDCRIMGNVDPDGRDEIEAILNDAGEDYLPMFKLDGNSRLDIYVCKDAQEFVKRTGADWWNGGHFVNHVIYIQRLEALKERGILEQTLVHEFLHYCIRRVAGNKCPVWLNEGLVLNITGEIRQIDCSGISIEGEVNKEELDKDIRSKDHERSRKGYCRAGLLVSRLLQSQGLERMLDGFIK
jgi:hypothetical protein